MIFVFPYNVPWESCILHIASHLLFIAQIVADFISYGTNSRVLWDNFSCFCTFWLFCICLAILNVHSILFVLLDALIVTVKPFNLSAL